MNAPTKSKTTTPTLNLDQRTVDGFGVEWTVFDQSDLGEPERQQQFDAYFSNFPWDELDADAVGFDLGCGTGRWAKLAAPRVGHLYCIDASSAALASARKNLADHPNCEFIEASVDQIPIDDGSMDFGYSLGVLHHIPDTAAGLASCVRKLKPGAPFALYIYYAFDNRRAWFRALWKASDLLRRVICRLPLRARHLATDVIAAMVYFPLARTAVLLERRGRDVDSFPLAGYRNRAYYSMKTDALDRFGTSLERRFTKTQILRMMEDAGLMNIQFNNAIPYWCAVGYRR